MKVHQSAANEADLELTDLLGEEGRLYKRGLLNSHKFSSVRLASTYEEMVQLLFDRAYIRPGYEVKEDERIVVPVFLVKLSGRADYIKEIYTQALKKSVKQFLHYPSFYTLERKPSAYTVSDLEKLLLNHDWIKEDLLLLNIPYYQALSDERLENFVEAVKKVVYWHNSLFMSHCTEVDALSYLVYDNRKILDAWLSSDYQETPPKCWINDPQHRVPHYGAVLRVLLMHALGFDVIVHSENSYASLENFLPDDWYDNYIRNDFNIKRKSTHKIIKVIALSIGVLIFLSWLL